MNLGKQGILGRKPHGWDKWYLDKFRPVPKTITPEALCTGTGGNCTEARKKLCFPQQQEECSGMGRWYVQKHKGVNESPSSKCGGSPWIERGCSSDGFGKASGPFQNTPSECSSLEYLPGPRMSPEDEYVSAVCTLSLGQKPSTSSESERNTEVDSWQLPMTSSSWVPGRALSW